jgi:hypothetical protein
VKRKSKDGKVLCRRLCCVEHSCTLDVLHENQVASRLKSDSRQQFFQKLVVCAAKALSKDFFNAHYTA